MTSVKGYYNTILIFLSSLEWRKCSTATWHNAPKQIDVQYIFSNCILCVLNFLCLRTATRAVSCDVFAMLKFNNEHDFPGSGSPHYDLGRTVGEIYWLARLKFRPTDKFVADCQIRFKISLNLYSGCLATDRLTISDGSQILQPVPLALLESVALAPSFSPWNVKRWFITLLLVFLESFCQAPWTREVKTYKCNI